MFGWDFLLMLSRDSEDEMWSRFMYELLIWLQEVTLARWTQPSGPLCLWQCFNTLEPLWKSALHHTQISPTSENESYIWRLFNLHLPQKELCCVNFVFNIFSYKFLESCPPLWCSVKPTSERLQEQDLHWASQAALMPFWQDRSDSNLTNSIYILYIQYILSIR